MCETELKLIFYVWHQEKLWFSIKNIFDFFSGEKNLCVKPSWKLFFKTCFLFHVWNRIETKWKFLCENKKNFFEWKLIFHEQDQQNVCISTCETPTQKNFILRRTFFFFPAKKIFVQQKKLFMCETEIKPFFQQWNQGRVCFGHVKQKNPFFRRKTYYSF